MNHTLHPDSRRLAAESTSTQDWMATKKRWPCPPFIKYPRHVSAFNHQNLHTVFLRTTCSLCCEFKHCLRKHKVDAKMETQLKYQIANLESKQYFRIFLKTQTHLLIMMQWKTKYCKVKLGPSLQHKGTTHSTQHTHTRTHARTYLCELIWVSLCHSKSFCH